MKFDIFKLLFLTLVILLFFSSCYEIDEGYTPEETNLEETSTISSLLKKISTKDGTMDNIIDESSCFCLDLPVTVMVNGTELLVTSEKDYDTIHEMLDDASDDDVRIVFPAVILFNNHAKITIHNQSEFDGLKNSCNEEDEMDTIIKCVDLKYPIKAYVYNSANDQSKIVTIDGDKKMYRFIEHLNRHEITNLKFPITLILHHKTETSVSSLVALETAIQKHKEECN